MVIFFDVVIELSLQWQSSIRARINSRTGGFDDLRSRPHDFGYAEIDRILYLRQHEFGVVDPV